MARVSLGLLAMPSVVACFDSPPQYSEPARVPPVIIADQVDPPVTKLYVPGEVANFDVAFRADDGGQKIAACFVRDVGVSTAGIVAVQQAPPDPRPFADQEVRHVSIPWAWKTAGGGTSPGCHTMTAIVADQNDFFTGTLCDTAGSLTEARITWFVLLQTSDTKSLPTIDCFQGDPSGVMP